MLNIPIQLLFYDPLEFIALLRLQLDDLESTRK